jgi:hypothetical protein
MPHHPPARPNLQRHGHRRPQSSIEAMAIKPIAVSPHTSECKAQGRIVAPRPPVLPNAGNAEARRVN